ncbi:4-hydroxythreonine-4-phosphate dehydrogenase [Robiginitalea myxolifaciens]|uniref:4-hydroxythreonine-4-phosphate dehydrogenase n=1 Tax=Robiginitalea myxolifaciens TaxID=400055 RepID=A0A1I6G4D6_9FLAO|nr:4-hydroxythreonine-4-phosphate dehydrogenase PdxA [Robiginitalea myxolifaciens]SFR37032.1 4-hydroxythreonine-4-phosphate dehydrogenase [Robiginitalea myxolifaciens]
MQEAGQPLKVGISIGDLSGIGCEIILKTFEDSRMLELCTPVIFAAAKTISRQKDALGIDLRFQGIGRVEQAVEGKINVVNVWKDSPEIPMGKASPESGAFAIKSLKAAVAALKSGAVDLLVTAPIDKKSVQSDAFKFPGHTDYLAQELEGESLMFMVTDTLKVGLLTDHVPVSQAPSMITPKLLEQKVVAMEKSLIQDFRIQRPRIAVLGINPHSGDEGVIGREDEDIMKPTLAKLAAAGHLVFGPYAADTFFASGNHEKFDAVLAGYHDQGLIPFKTLAFGKGVNFTAGLSQVRTSPDHGTAYDIAGKGIADPSSFREALFTGIRILRNRREFEALTSNPLKQQKLKRPPRKGSRKK